MLVNDVAKLIEKSFPLTYAEDFDNVGLLIGSGKEVCHGVLVSLDCTEGVVDEAIEKKCNMIVSFHPIIFSGLKKINGNNYVERVVIKAIQHNIVVYALHTALDNYRFGVSHILGEKLGLLNQRVLLPQAGTQFALQTTVSGKEFETLQEPLQRLNVQILNSEDLNTHTMTKSIQLKCNKDVLSKVKKLVEEVTQQYDNNSISVTKLENENRTIGMGSIGDLPNEMEVFEFLDKIKKLLGISYLRHSNTKFNKIRKVAVLGGSGSFAISTAIAQGADVYITADLKYHDFFKAEEKLLLCDVGHYESEQFTKSFLVTFLKEKIPNFAIILSETRTNPVNYY